MVAGIRIERRGSYRVSVMNGRARCSTKSKIGSYSVKDLSMGGILLSGGPRLDPGTHLQVVLRLPGRSPAVFGGKVSRVVRDTRRGAEIAVAFDQLSADQEDTIEDTIVFELTRETRKVVLVIDPEGAKGDQMLLRNLRASGRRVVQAATPLDAIARLEDPRVPIGAVFMGASVGKVRGIEFASFLADTYPKIRRVLLATRGRRANKRPTVDAVLREPWTIDRVAESIQSQGATPLKGPAKTTVKKPARRPTLHRAISSTKSRLSRKTATR